MKVLLRILGAVLGLLVVLGIAQFVASESGEVVVLTTSDAQGNSHETRVWVVDHEGKAWLRAGAAMQAWYGRLTARPNVEVERNGNRRRYIAVPQPLLRPVVNDLMLEKYGWADRFIGALFGRDDAIPIRLDPNAR
ncbi:MAG: hypothetical protein JRH16_05765 [Deltaproteobacteria bacterium]|nr:hypothetical protein [Deltaproteobacteria bacterium]MBW2361361.1 hypothetical protein [Deltaproteobacteria bacterium]